MKRLLTILIFAFSLLTAPAFAQDGMTVIRDTEIEQTLRDWSTPVWRAAGLNPDNVKLVLVQSPDLNAFVAGGTNIFVFTGLIAAAKTPGEVIGVIAHETGHIAGGHLIKGRQAMEHASYESILAMILGVGAAAAGGGDASRAIIMGGQGLALTSYLAHSRVQESSADQAALRFLEAAQYSPDGLASFLGTLKNQELMPESQQSAYFRTHPLTRERIDAMEQGDAKSAYKGVPLPASMTEEFKRIKAKLAGFTEPERVAWIYSDKDDSTPALYARAIAAYRRSDTDVAIKLIDTLIGREKNNPWFHEIKGQMLRDFGRVADATKSYREAIRLAPDAALIRIDLAQVLIEMPNGDYTEAERQLDEAIKKEPKSTQIHRLYATLYGRQGDEGAAQYHLAEEAALRGKTEEAQKLLEGAMTRLKPGTKAYRQATDLKVYLDAQPKKDDRKKP
ncbi:MAG: M48 family metalloprotease [Alphaproteobacteria bacterium]|nr:M48 family metalloprotease [Alphaproteobacteria bacterium]